MKTSANISVQVTLTLTEAEVRWLHDYMQNPIKKGEEESSTDRNFREIFFHATALQNLKVPA